KKVWTILRKVFNAGNLRSGYPRLRSQSILSKSVRGKVFGNKELDWAPLFFSATGLGVVLTFQFALPITWVKVMRHIAKILLWKTEAAPRPSRVVEFLRSLSKKPLRSFAPLDSRWRLSLHRLSCTDLRGQFGPQ